MKSNALKLLVAVFSSGSLLAATLPAEARDHRRDHREWRHSHPGNAYGHRNAPRHVVVHKSAPKRTVVHQHYYHYPAPHYAPPRHYRPVNRYAPPPVNRYAPPVYYSRDPAIVIGVSVPPIIIPIR